MVSSPRISKGLRSGCTPRISKGPAGYRINRDFARPGRTRAGRCCLLLQDLCKSCARGGYQDESPRVPRVSPRVWSPHPNLIAGTFSNCFVDKTLNIGLPINLEIEDIDLKGRLEVGRIVATQRERHVGELRATHARLVLCWPKHCRHACPVCKSQSSSLPAPTHRRAHRKDLTKTSLRPAHHAAPSASSRLRTPATHSQSPRPSPPSTVRMPSLHTPELQAVCTRGNTH